MRLKKITLEGFQSYWASTTVDLSGCWLTAIVGENGSGKTTLLDAVVWALWGRSRGDTAGAVISRGADRAQVTVEFHVGDDRYRVTRTRTTGGRHEVMVQTPDPTTESGWKAVTEKNPTVADRAITEILGVDFPTAQQTWLIPQGQVASLCEMPPAARRDLLATLFRLDRYADLEKDASAKLGDATRELDRADHTLGGLELQQEQLRNQGGPYPDLDDDALAALGREADQAAEAAAAALATIADPDAATRALVQSRRDLATYQDQVRQAGEQHGRESAWLTQNVTHARRDHDQATAEHRRALGIAAGIPNLEQAHTNALTATETARQNLVAATAQVDEAQQTLAALRAEQNHITPRGQELTDQLSTLTRSQGECFTCGQALTPARAQELITTQEKARGELRARYTQLQGQITESERRLRTARTAVKEAQTAVDQNLRAQMRTDQALTEAVRVADTLPDLEARLRATAEAVADAEAARDALPGPPQPDPERVKELQTAIDHAARMVSDAQHAAQAREQHQQERATARARHQQVLAEQARREAVAEQLVTLQGLVEDAEQARAAAEGDVADYGALQAAFRPSGIPAMILAGVVEEVNEAANRYLTTLGGDLGINVAFTQKGGQEKVLINVLTPTGEVSYSTLSGAEKFRIALALRCALAACMTRRTGRPNQTIILDEGWGSLDETTRTAVATMLGTLAQEFAIFTISHIPAVQEAFPTVMQVTRVGGSSQVEVVHRN